MNPCTHACDNIQERTMRGRAVAPSPARPSMAGPFLGRQRRPYIVFRFRSSYGFMFVYIYTPLPWQPRENISRKQASRDITGSKKHIYAQGRLNPVISQPKYGRCER